MDNNGVKMEHIEADKLTRIPKELESLAKEARKYKSAREFWQGTGGGKYNLDFIEKMKVLKDNELAGIIGDFIISPKMRKLFGEDVLNTKIAIKKNISKKVAILGAVGTLNKTTEFGKKGERIIIIDNKPSHMATDIIETLLEEIAHTKRALLGREMRKIDLEKFSTEEYEKLPQEISVISFKKFLEQLEENKQQLTDFYNQVVKEKENIEHIE